MMKKYNGGKQMTSVWQIRLCTGGERLKGADGKKAHSTQKPEELLKRVILSTTKQGDIVLDPFFGTGTTGAAARKLKRKFIGIEREPEYVSLAKKRIDAVETFFPEADWREEEGENRKRVPFEALLQERLITAGERLYARKTCAALVLPDGKLEYNNYTGSIHKIGAMIQQTPSCNGWKFWFILRDDTFILIDDLRSEYLRNKHES
jgi:modification methylase